MNAAVAKGLFGLCLLGAAGCADAPPATSPGTGALWGYVGLVRREGVKPVKKDDPVYADRRLGDIETVDYRKPGFAVVFLEGPASPGGRAPLAFRADQNSPRFEPPRVAIGSGGVVVLKNADSRGRIFSCPQADFIGRLEPGEERELRPARPGIAAVSALDAGDCGAAVFVVSGPYCVAREDGRWELKDLPPGRGTLQAWHQRFPPAFREIDVPADSSQRIDLELRVENIGKPPLKE